MLLNNINYVINHLFLPPILPQADDTDVECQTALLSHVVESADAFCQALNNAGVEQTVVNRWRILSKMLLSMKALRQDAFIDLQKLQSAVQDMQVDDVLCLYITKQNAGIVLRGLETEIALEFFQASPTAASVTSTTGKLVIQFPSRPRLSIPRDPRLIKSFCTYLVDMDSTEMPKALPTTAKAKSEHIEYREVPDIRYITELLGGIARTLTSDVSAMASSTVYVTKRVNDHVLWDRVEHPWRRDPQWLVMRVALQTSLSEWEVDERYGYKAFITFVLARVLEQALKTDLDLDLLHIMNVKVATRIWKLRSLVHVAFPFEYIQHVSQSCRQYLDDQWDIVKDWEARPHQWTAPTNDDIRQAENFPLTNSREYLSAVYNRSSELQRQINTFSPEEFEATLTRKNLRKMGVSPPIPIDTAAAGFDLWLAILDVEHWTANVLHKWESNTPTGTRLNVLKDMINRHDNIASSSDNPELFSRVFLVILELWVALDKTVIEAIPLLKEYSPGLTISSFEPLLLPTLSQMKRLRTVEDYIQSRHDNASPMCRQHSLFQFIAHEDSFAARYFQVDKRLQKLRSKIVAEATETQTQKIEECMRRNEEYRQRERENRGRECDTFEYQDKHGHWRSRHPSYCTKCRETKELNKMRITVFEWPLPEEDILSRLVVFELQVPKPVGVWRDITYHLARHYSSNTPDGNPTPTPVLRNYPALQKYHSPSLENQRISIASKTKSFLVAHYRDCHFPCSKDMVIKPHGLQYSLYDVAKGEWIPSNFPEIAIRDNCTPNFCFGPYKSLAWAGGSTTHTSNEVIARQSQCPIALSYHEWEAFGHIRSGHRLQWRNMMLELTNGTIALKDSTVHFLFRQAAWQVEKRSDVDYREAHIDPGDESFGVDAVSVLRGRLDCICDNWQEGWTASTLSVLACRLFSLCHSVVVQDSIRGFLSDLRITVWKWLDQVVRLQGEQGTRLGIDRDPTENLANDTRSRVIQLAAICRSTYALGPDEVDHLFNDPHNVSIFIKCAIVLQDNTPGNLISLQTHLRYLTEGNVVLSADVIKLLVQAVLRNNEGLEDAIRYVWQGFRRDPSTPWRTISDRWIACKTSSRGSTEEARHVSLNLLDGTVLVDGRTLRNLPKGILQHPLFHTVFPNQFTMDIVPSTMKGMEYQLSRDVQDRLEIHFAMKGGDLLIRTRDINSQNLSEFVPGVKLQGDVPNAILLDAVHIYHESSHCLKVYPATSGWDPAALPIWIMRFSADPKLATPNNHPKLTNARSEGTVDCVLSPESPLLRKLSEIFRPLEACITNLFVTHSRRPNGDLNVALPRYKLSFFVGTGGLLECKELPGMFVSCKQSIGTLYGLKNKLVLDPKDPNTTRKVILPDGDIKVSRGPNHPALHPEVTILPCEEPGQQIRMFVYDVDDLIGRLVGDGTVLSWYLLAYLHVLTSSHLSDPLTYRTGVQQALAMLQSPNAFAFTQLAPEDVRLLTFIYSLTPVRMYYPRHLCSMEQVNWNPELSPLSQSELFVPFVEAIVDYRNKQALFDPTSTDLPFQYKGAPALRSRAELRNRRLVSSEVYEADSHHDHYFLPTRCLRQSEIESVEKERVVFDTTTLVANWTNRRQSFSLNIWEQFQGWNIFSTKVDTHNSFDSPIAWLSKSPSEIWFSLFSLCLDVSKEKEIFGLMFALGIASYRSDINIQIVYVMWAIATNSPSSSLRHAASLLPRADTFFLSLGYDIDSMEVRDIAKEHSVSFESSPQVELPRHTWETQREADDRRWNAYCSLRDTQCQSLATYIFQQWPGSVATMPTRFAIDYTLIHELHFKAAVLTLFHSRFLNRRLFQHSEKLQAALDQIPYRELVGVNLMLTMPVPKTPEVDKPCPRYVPVTLSDLVRSNDRLAFYPRPTGVFLSEVSSVKREKYPTSESVLGQKASTRPLSTRDLVQRLSERSSSGLSTRYISDLRKCVNALETQSEPSVERLRTSHRSLTALPRQTSSKPSVLDIQTALSPQDIPEKTISSAGLWPCSGPDSLLSLLTFYHRRELHDDWNFTLIGFAEGLAKIQRDKRIAVFGYLGLESEQTKEIQNHGGRGWEALEYPDWLLIQIDANLLIRPVQAAIAHEMMSPKSRQNTVMQLNMGEGKSSVIVPIISTALADGGSLVRVIVLKPLCAQMFHLLKQRICGLANRRLYYLPFSRNVSLDEEKVRIIFDMFKACTRDGGVLLCQPEHILSFQLMGLHLLCHPEDFSKAAPFLEVQRWLDVNTRDILDESDEILSVRYQLIYTIGTPEPLQCQPDRWQIIQNVFSLIKNHLNEVASTHPDGLELEPVDNHSQRFPRTRILTHQCGQSLLRSIAHQIVFKEKLPSTPFRSYSRTLRTLAFRFVTEDGITQADSDILEKCSGEYFDQLLLLRGLVANGILLLSLKDKRWRVDYGLDPSRTMLAVPYRAKDCPAPRAEFGHPDMIIVLTCLSYYYGGLSDHELESTFHQLYNSDDPSSRYEDWIKGSLDVPESLRSLRGLNFDDYHQKYHQIFPRLRDNKVVIDFYLSECVFPKEAKSFRHKLTTNSWDLARTKTKLTTGFSGTNDNRYLLPLSIDQLDSQDQRHTNAQVLEYILCVENRTVVHTGSVTALGLIEKVVEQKPHVTVLLDVGAQVLELQNKEVAQEWLKRDKHPTVEAAVYCDPTNDEFYVLRRDGHVEPFQRSLYKTQLSKVLVYLDEARTRGTDFKFPACTRAAVTLGPKLCKDKLVQGCMRMRRLGSDHSVLFFASSEIRGKIQASIGDHEKELNSSDVLIWTIHETWTQLKDNGAHWVSQGLNFDIRHTAWDKYSMDYLSSSGLAKILQERESRTLKELYGVKENDSLFEWSASEDGLSGRQKSIQARCHEFGIALSRSTALLEEQERELAHEKEEERQVERVSASSPRRHAIDRGLRRFIQSGTISDSFISLVDCLEGTSQGTSLLTLSTSFFQSSNLRATDDFSRTIKGGHVPGSMDDFLRPVRWILHSKLRPGMLLIISPFEANELLPEIRESIAHLHLYSPRVSRQVASLDDMKFFVVPSLRSCTRPSSRTIQELNLFAGQLFFRDKASFKEVCNMLGLHLGEIPDEVKGKVDPTGFVLNETARRILGLQTCVFHANGVLFLRELTRWRRKGHGFTLTHVGDILHGNDIREFQF